MHRIKEIKQNIERKRAKELKLLSIKFYIKRNKKYLNENMKFFAYWMRFKHLNKIIFYKCITMKTLSNCQNGQSFLFYYFFNHCVAHGNYSFKDRLAVKDSFHLKVFDSLNKQKETEFILLSFTKDEYLKLPFMNTYVNPRRRIIHESIIWSSLNLTMNWIEISGWEGSDI